MNIRHTIRGAGIAAATTAAIAAAAPAQAADCDRACLSGMVTQYVDALVAHDPSKLPLAEGARFTEDSRDLKFGEGAWQTITGKSGFRHDYIDTAKQVAVAHVGLLEGDKPVLFSVVLRVADGRITGAETLVERITPESRFKPTELGKPIRGMNDPIPAGKRDSREAMVDIALKYADGLRRGNFTDAGVPFAPETYRVENGVITAGEGCRSPVTCDLYAQRIMVHPGLLPSVAAVDEEAGTVVLWMNFGFTDSYGPGNALVTFETFKIWGGQIHAINAFFRTTMPISTPRAWPSLEPVD